MKKIIALIAVFSLCLCIFAGCTKTEPTGRVENFSPEEYVPQTEAPETKTEAPETEAEEETGAALHHVEIDIRDFGTVKLELDAGAAPITVENFLNLAGSGFYNGLTFHRIIEGFMMQGGDPTGTGMGGSEKTIRGEFAQNGVDNPLLHTRGAISMARSGHPDSASSQFFIVHEDAPFLDGQYACFGYVTEGMDVVDAVCRYSSTVAKDQNDTLAPEDQPVMTEVRVID